MSFIDPPGSMILICPVELSAGTMSKAVWDSIMSDPTHWNVQSISHQVFAQWLSNAKIVALQREVNIVAGGVLTSNTYNETLYQARRVLTPFGHIVNTENHPYPLMRDWGTYSEYFGTDYTNGVNEFNYKLSNGDNPIHSAYHCPPDLCIYNKGFYVITPISPSYTTQNITISADEYRIENFTDQGGGDYTENIYTYTITQTYYNNGL